MESHFPRKLKEKLTKSSSPNFTSQGIIKKKTEDLSRRKFWQNIKKIPLTLHPPFTLIHLINLHTVICISKLELPSHLQFTPFLY